jgi:hypothetical protein
MTTRRRGLAAPASTVLAVAVMALVLSATGHGDEVMVVTLTVVLFVRLLARRYADDLRLAAQFARHGDRMD